MPGARSSIQGVRPSSNSNLLGTLGSNKQPKNHGKTNPPSCKQTDLYKLEPGCMHTSWLLQVQVPLCHMWGQPHGQGMQAHPRGLYLQTASKALCQELQPLTETGDTTASLSKTLANRICSLLFTNCIFNCPAYIHQYYHLCVVCYISKLIHSSGCQLYCIYTALTLV